MKKKLLAAIIAAALAVSLLAGCGAQGNTNSSLFCLEKEESGEGAPCNERSSFYMMPV